MHARSLLLLLALVAAACNGTGERQREADERRREALAMFEELVQQGTLDPVESMEDPYAGIEPAMGATPEERAAADTAEQATELAPAPEQAAARPFNPWTEFGQRILWDEQRNLVMKPFPLPPGNSENVLWLLQEYLGLPLHDPATGPQGPATVRLDLQAGFDAEAFSPNLRGSPAEKPLAVPLLDWLIVTASPENLREVEYFLDTFVAGAPQIEIEAKVVEWTTRESFDMGTVFSAELADKVFVKDIDYDFPNTVSEDFLTTIGFVQDGVIYDALIEMLATFENVSIISRPKVAVREGTKAMIEATDRIPFLQVTNVNNSGGFNTKLQFQEVGVRLFVVPRLAGTSQIALEIDVEASQQTGVEVTATLTDDEGNAQEIAVPRLVQRQAETLVYLKPGQAVILGGLSSERTVEVQRKIPFLGDLPGLGALFRSTFEEKERAQVLFFIRPRILQGSDFSRQP